MNNFKCKLDDLFKELDLNYNDINLYYEAFSHPSYGNENGTNKNYERLEFLGDAILDFLVGEYLYKTTNLLEGQMSKLRAEYVCEQANAQYSVSMKLNKLIMVGVGAKRAHEDLNKSVLGNIFESFLGALYLDHDMEYVRNVLCKWVFPKIGNMKVHFFVDYKTKLQESMQAERSESPIYLIVNESGPAHNKTFEAMVKVDGIKLGRGIGKTKKDAEQEAAKDALEKLAKI